MVITSADDEYLIALVNRFWTTWLICCLSANTWTGWAVSGKECGRDTKRCRSLGTSVNSSLRPHQQDKGHPGNSKNLAIYQEVMPVVLFISWLNGIT
jgi:hypothetical protein